MKKLKLIIIIVIIIILSFTAYAFRNSIYEIFEDLGKNEKEIKTQTNKDDIYAKGINIIISKQEVEIITSRYKSGGVDNGEELAVKYILKREVLYNKAIKNNYSASDQEINDLIANKKDVFKKAENRDEFLSYLYGLGQTEEEYFKNQYDIYKKDILINKYIEKLKSDFLKENNKDAFDEDLKKLWNEKFEKIVNDLIAIENIKYNK